MNNFLICKSCLHRKTDTSGNLFCGYNIEPESNLRCSQYQVDEMEKIRLEIKKAKASQTASSGIRFANYIIDFIAIFLLGFLLGIVLVLVSLLLGADISWLDNMNKLTEYFFNFLLMSFYYIFFEGLFGQTLGKMITRTKVVTLEGEKPKLESIMTRTLCRFIPFEQFSFLGSDAVGWHDSFSKTRVVSTKS